MELSTDEPVSCHRASAAGPLRGHSATAQQVEKLSRIALSWGQPVATRKELAS